MTEFWAHQHVRENPGHIVTESIFLPPWCETCEAKSPAWGMEKAETPTFEETLRLVEELVKRYPAPPLPSRIDVSTSVLEVLRSKARAAGVDTSAGDNPLFGIPVVEDPDLAPGEWKIIQRPQIGDPCARCGKPTSLQGEEGVLLTATKAYHVFCPPTPCPNCGRTLDHEREGHHCDPGKD